MLVAAVPAGAAQTAEWEIRSFDSEIVINPDGSMDVTETIAVTFHARRHGIYREIPYQIPVDGDQVRRYRFDRVRVQTGSGTPGQLEQERSGDFRVWRIGDPDVEITGEHTYQISYRVRGGLNRFETHDELFWNITGDRWDVPIGRASATVRAPEVSEVSCFAGYTGETDPCAQASHDGAAASFAAGTLEPGQQLDVVVAIPPGLVEVAPPDLHPANQVLRVFQVDALRLTGGGAVGLFGLAGAVVLARRGRDERAAPRVAALPGGVEYRPPEELRPAQLRTLLTQKVDGVSLSATLVDLAVRGYVRIEEIPKGLFGKQDWTIHRVVDAPAGELQAYEQELLCGLFGTGGRGRDSVTVSALGKGKFHPYYKRITKLLYQDVVARGYFAHNPASARALVVLLAVVSFGLGSGGVGLMFSLDWTFGLVLTPLPVLGVLLLLVSRWAPRRTAAGTAMNQRTQGFREFIRTAEADRMAFAEREQIFAACLPYAMAFDCVQRWVQAFERIGVAPAAATGGWYVGHGAWDFGRVSSSMSSLSSQVGGTMRQTASGSGSSGSSGSSGGGGGGGGGGSW